MNRWYSYTTYGNNAEALYSIEYRGIAALVKLAIYKMKIWIY